MADAITAFGIMLLFTAVAGLLAFRLKMPPVVGLLLAGMVIGPNVLNLVDQPTIQTFAEIGAVLLLFMIGVEFSVAKLLSSGLRPILSSFLLVLISFAVMHEAAILLGFDAITALYIGAIFSMSSTAIMMKILEQKRLVERQEVPVLVTMLIIEDILAVFLLTFFSGLKGGAYTSGNIILSLLLAFGILGFGYLAASQVLRKITIGFLRYHPEETLVLVAFTLGIGMSVLASLLGLTPAIGAFLAGSIIAGLPNGREFEDAVRPFSKVFPSFFFISIGMLINPAALLQSADITLHLIGMFMATVFAATALTYFLISSSGRSAVFAGLAMLPLGEFSLLIAKESLGVAQINLVGIAAVGVLITSLLSSLALTRSEQAYLTLKRILPSRFQEAQHRASGYVRNVISAFEPGGYFHKHLLIELKTMSVDALLMIAILLSFALARPLFPFTVRLGAQAIGAEVLLMGVAALLLAFPLSRTVLSLKRLFDALAVIFSRTTPQASKGVIARNVAVSAALFFLFVNTYAVVEVMMLPKIFNWLAPVFGVLSAFFLWSAIRAASLWIMLAEKKAAGLFRSRVGASKNDLIVVAKRGRGGKGKKKPKLLFLR